MSTTKPIDEVDHALLALWAADYARKAAADDAKERAWQSRRLPKQLRPIVFPKQVQR